MRVIIAGGSGMIGRALVDELAGGENEIIVLSRSPEKVTGLPEGARAEKWDGKSVDGWGHLVDGAEAVINMAGANIGESRWTSERKRLIMTSRIESTQAVVEAISQANTKPEVLLQGSAVGYYGGNRGDEIMTETSEPGVDFIADVVKKWESAVAPAAEMTRLVIARTANVLTTKDGALNRLISPVNFIAELTVGDGIESAIDPALKPLNFLSGGGPLGSGKQWMHWIHIEDEINALLFLLKNKAISGIYNLAAPEALRNREFTQVLSKVLQRPSFIPVPGFVIKMLVGEMASLVLEGQRVSGDKIIEAGYDFEYPKAMRALKDIIYSEK
ncbi:MAG: DUF1731 domain-containing protein [Chloroflexota bacterium]